MSERHPLMGFGTSVTNFKSFGKEGFQFIDFSPINIIIGRNNSGKSALVDLLDLCINKEKKYDSAKHDFAGQKPTVFLKKKVSEAEVASVFREGISSTDIGVHATYGRRFVGLDAVLRMDVPAWKRELSNVPENELSNSIAPNYQNRLAEAIEWPFAGLHLLRVAAERDVRPEPRTDSRELEANGQGTTNLVRAFINSDDLPRAEVEIGLLSDLNKIYSGDSKFSAIICRESKDQVWEIFLREDNKGDIRLSESGSSLKSIFIVLCLLRLVPRIRQVPWERVVLSVEEPENNLHPALLRRLLNFLAERRAERKFTLIIATHSPVGIDWATKRTDSQIIHVKHNGASAAAHVAVGYSGGREILNDLDIRASDILQANGVIWVEGPSDRIYLNKWIELHTAGGLKEGVHYSIMFYGGKLLSHLDALAPKEGGKLISLMALNRNAAIVMDSDRHQGKAATKEKAARKPRMHLNGTKMRLKDELDAIGGYVWITEGREVENYVSKAVLMRAANLSVDLKVGMYDTVVELSALSAFKGDKIALAHRVAEVVTSKDDLHHLDLVARLDQLCDAIRGWNGPQ